MANKANKFKIISHFNTLSLVSSTTAPIASVNGDDSDVVGVNDEGDVDDDFDPFDRHLALN